MGLKKQFAKGDRVRISPKRWPDAPRGVILSAVTTQIYPGIYLDDFYHVRFDEPAQDRQGEGPYSSAVIRSRDIDMEDEANSAPSAA